MKVIIFKIKKIRYYFKDSIILNKEQIYFSNIDLNVEHGKIEKPIVPTLRIATPVFVNGEKKGIFIININMKAFLEKFQKSSLYDIGLVYDDGNIIVYKDKKHIGAGILI